MSCNCSRAKQLPSCIDLLIIGDVEDGSKSYYVYFKTPDGRIDRYSAVDVVYTDLIGVEDIEVRTGTIYEVWVTLTTAENMNERIAFTPIEEIVTVTCVLLEFLPCYEGSDQEEFVSQAITLE